MIFVSDFSAMIRSVMVATDWLSMGFPVAGE